MFGEDGEIAIPITGNLRANNGDALLAAALAGQGLIYQPTFLVGDNLRDGSLVRLLSEFAVPELGVYAVLPSGRQAPAKVRVVIDFLAARFAPIPDWDRDL